MTGAQNTTVGLRVDVDTLRGTRDGVPRLLEILAKHGVTASFFFCVGPDNMGRHIWRLLRPQFLAKMLRSNAANLYGWDILLRGTFWPGTEIGRRCAPIIRQTAACGHEVGLHAWDHHAWQSHSLHWSVEQQREQTNLGLTRLSDIIGRRVDCSAVAGWRCDQRTIEAKQSLALRYNSDCRGREIFRPRLANNQAGIPQVPVTLPTFDEVIGHAIDRLSYNEFILSHMKPSQLNVYTVHAEVEGIALAHGFDSLLGHAAERGTRFVSLGSLLPVDASSLPLDTVVPKTLPGREGWIGWQSSAAQSAIHHGS
jgi:undecaprenyl phosphate-alpha-L-ara4FN deformylase